MQILNPGDENRLEKPCLVETSQGFSVSYKNRFLYSKYSPKRAIEQAIRNMQILPNTLVLCASPALWHGLDVLLEKIPDGCMILGIETDASLSEFAESELEKLKNSNPEIFNSKRVEILPHNETNSIVEILIGKEKSKVSFPHISTFKRAIMIEMSGGTLFGRDFYREIENAAENAIASFWKNRITLANLGRLFSKNLLENMANLPSSFDLKRVLATIDRPIIVFGAGESTQHLLDKIKRKSLEKMFVLAVDAVVPALQANGVRIDAVVAVEAQLAIEKAYIGGGAENSVIFADMSSRPAVTAHTKKGVCFFASEAADTNFFNHVAGLNFFPPVIPPLGSVGLTATYIALLLRKNISVPVFVTGLDFSYSLGKTHTEGTPQQIARLSSSNRFSPKENYDASFKVGAQKITGKNGKIVFTDIALSGYAKSFSHTFCNQKNLFDVGECGIELGLAKADVSSSEFWNLMQAVPKCKTDFADGISLAIKADSTREEKRKDVLSFLESEEKSLERIKELLIFGSDVAKCGTTVETELSELISEREYLFIHFPDGHRFDISNLSQLKRIRTETDFFLKTIRKGIKRITKKS